MNYPVARRDDLLISEEGLVYDARCSQVHSLSTTAREVWSACDGRSSLALLARIASKTAATPFDTDMVLYLLQDLAERGLLQDDALPTPSVSRNELVLRGMEAVHVRSTPAPR